MKPTDPSDNVEIFQRRLSGGNRLHMPTLDDMWESGYIPPIHIRR
jgi:hypothetical protein